MYLTDPVVSIIVPVYRAEKTLGRCVDSILAQTLVDFELILVDDGSPDGSGALCDFYAQEDGRVRVIHQENSGVAQARNNAIAAAGGQYLQFVDSDDWLAPEATQLLVEAAQCHQADLVVADFFRVSGNLVASKHRRMPENPITRAQYASAMMENPASFYFGVLWNKLYRRELIRQHQLRMNPKVRICEDLLFNLDYLRFVHAVASVSVPVYYYVRNQNSLVMQTPGTTTLKIRLSTFEDYRRFYMDVLDDSAYQKARHKVYRFLVDVATDGVVLPRPAPHTRILRNEDVPRAMPEDIEK